MFIPFTYVYIYTLYIYIIITLDMYIISIQHMYNIIYITIVHHDVLHHLTRQDRSPGTALRLSLQGFVVFLVA
jgi:hypothetical protein